MPPSSQLNLPLLQRRAWWVVFGAVIAGGLSLTIAAAQWATIATIPLPVPPSLIQWLLSDDAFVLISAALVAMTIMWLFWLHRAVANLRAVSAPAMIWSPGAAILWCLIPIISWAMGFFIMRAIWRGTFGRTDLAPFLVTGWAVAAIAPTAVALIPVAFANDINAYDLRSEALANGLQALACALEASLVMSLTRGQAGMRSISDTFA